MRWPGGRRYRLGVRGLVTEGRRAGSTILVDDAGMGDPLVVVVISPDLDVPGHPDEEHHFVWDWELAEQLRPAAIRWTGPTDNSTADRFR
jgi:hypothetical protein